MKSKSTVVTGAPWRAAAALPIRMASSRTAATAATTGLSNGTAFMLVARRCYQRQAVLQASPAIASIKPAPGKSSESL
jgi:hypothetical protein